MTLQKSWKSHALYRIQKKVLKFQKRLIQPIWSLGGGRHIQPPLSRNCIYTEQVNNYFVQHVRANCLGHNEGGASSGSHWGTREVLLKRGAGLRATSGELAAGSRPEDQSR